MAIRFPIALLLAAFTATASAQSAIPPSPPETELTAAPSPAADIGAALVEKLVAVCARHPEVERAFVMIQPGKDGLPIYMFVPIFDRKVADEVLSEAQSAYHELAPNGGYLPVMLLARNTWKKSLGGVPPIYLRPKK